MALTNEPACETTKMKGAVCEACGGAFECGAAAAGCWCTGVVISEETQAALRAKFGHCLCRTCLEGYAAREASSAADAAPDAVPDTAIDMMGGTAARRVS